jgi:hypothetical protein
VIAGIGTVAFPTDCFAQRTGDPLSSRSIGLGYLSVAADANTPPYRALLHGLENTPPYRALLHGLEELGYVEGRNLEVQGRLAEGRTERLPALAAELLH